MIAPQPPQIFRPSYGPGIVICTVFFVEKLGYIILLYVFKKTKNYKKMCQNMIKSKINEYQYYRKLFICVDYNNRDFRDFLVHDFANTLKMIS